MAGLAVLYETERKIKKKGAIMRLVIDCFKLVKGKGKSIGIYNLAQSLVQHLTAANKSGEHCEEIIVLGNEYNRKDFDIPGIRFVLMKGNPLNKLTCIVWELFLVPWKARKYGADRILFPTGLPSSVLQGKRYGNHT